MKRDVQAIQNMSQEWLKENTRRYAFKRLEKEIISTGVCTECGTCVSSCPVQVLAPKDNSEKYIPILVGKCIACGTCYAMCPRTLSLREDLIGKYLKIYKAKSKIVGGRKQDGGVATALLIAAIEQDMIEGAVVVHHDQEKRWLPRASIAKTKEQIESSGGTVYTHAPIVEEVLRGIKQDFNSLAVTGTSCNIDAIQRLQNHPAGFLNLADGITVAKLGLFCMESFDYIKLESFLKSHEIDISDVTHMAISGGEFTVKLDSEDRTCPISDLDNCAASSCATCYDLTCKSADISLGNIGSDDDWTTTIVRTSLGENLFDMALKNGYIIAEELDEKSIRRIDNIARLKATKHYRDR